MNPALKNPTQSRTTLLKRSADCLYPAIFSYFESETEKREFAQWQASQASLNEALGIEKLSGMKHKSIEKIESSPISVGYPSLAD